MKISDYGPYLSETLLEYLRNCTLASAEKQYLAAVVWGTVFLEAFLVDLSTKLKIPRPSQDDLNGRIQQLRQYSKNHAPTMPDVPDEIIKRCEDIRNTRNRLVHDTGVAKRTLAQDADFVHGGIQVILDWYRSLSPRNTGRENIQAKNEHAGVPVFISAITPDNDRQAYFLEVFFGRLRSIGIRPVRIEFDQFDQHEPIGKVARTLEGCCGLIVIGLERSHSYFVRDREGTEKQEDVMHRKYTSGWLHLEAGLAHALGKPVWVVCQKDICSDGIFDRSWNQYPVTELQTLDEDSADLDRLLRHLKEWTDFQQQKSG